ncbi:MAG: GxxExxY protein, partial [Candidatus Polarisedimenticolaceae bacterium]|nr:GxxExxY protein [Candidatus Polarisedimenticolaceae bacterium]
ELSMKDIPFIVQAPIPIQYKDIKLECGYRLDFLVDDCLILELKSVEKLLKIHEAQILTYLKLTHISTGLLINFNASRFWSMELNVTNDNSVFSVVSVSMKNSCIPHSIWHSPKK